MSFRKIDKYGLELTDNELKILSQKLFEKINNDNIEIIQKFLNNKNFLYNIFIDDKLLNTPEKVYDYIDYEFSEFINNEFKELNNLINKLTDTNIKILSKEICNLNFKLNKSKINKLYKNEKEVIKELKDWIDPSENYIYNFNELYCLGKFDEDELVNLSWYEILLLIQKIQDSFTKKEILNFIKNNDENEDEWDNEDEW